MVQVPAGLLARTVTVWGVVMTALPIGLPARSCPLRLSCLAGNLNGGHAARLSIFGWILRPPHDRFGTRRSVLSVVKSLEHLA
jgi:hypothetical protein